MVKLAYKYMRYYKSQTLAILAAIVLTAALLSGIGSLMHSSRLSDLDNNKSIYGDWHYCIETEGDVPEMFSREGDGYLLEQYGKKEIRDVITEPYMIYFVYSDESYREMAHREVVEGSYPESADEIAMDKFTLGNFGYAGNIGETISLNGKDYILTGILKSEWASDANDMEVFVGEGFAGQGARGFLYLKFNEGKKLYKQLDAFLDGYKLSGSQVELNEKVTMYLSGEKPDSIYSIIKSGIIDEGTGFTYIVLKLQYEYNLAYNVMLLLLCIFSLFIIYSIFNISVSKRISEYGMMQALGIGENTIRGTLIFELWILFILGYPAGCMLGNGILKVFYRKLNGIFAHREVGERISVQDGMGESGFHVSWYVIIIGFIFLFVALAFTGMLTVRSIRKYSVRQNMKGDTSFIRKRKIYSTGNYNLSGLVVRKFMFSNKKKVAGILLSLSIGGCIFFCTAYMVENLKVHAEMSLKSDDGLGSEYRISVKSYSLSDTIPKEIVTGIKGITGLDNVYATKYTLGELIIKENELVWDEYFDEQNKSTMFQERFGGICVENEDGTYGIKYDVYGYDTEMIRQLQDFILEGDIALDNSEEENKVIVTANKDGQGNYDFYGKHAGDTILLRVPKEHDCSPDILKFKNPDDSYIEKEFEIAAIVSRPLAKESNFLNADVWDSMQSIIMTDMQMEKLYGISDYSFINASLKNGVDNDVAGGEILKQINDVPKAVLQDYTNAIRTQKDYLNRQQLFFSAIAVILLIISLFHIINSMNYSIIAHRREYGIIRAMGITDICFYKIILKMGLLYGLLADSVIFLIYNLMLRRVMDYYMVHVVQFLHITAEVPMGIWLTVMWLNVMIAVVAVMIPAAKITKENIISEIKLM